jgi:peptide/nickel transport system permease protein
MMRRVRELGIARIILFAFTALLVLVAIAPQWFTPWDPAAIDASSILQGPSWAHPLGTDEAGADVLARILYATRLELIIAVGSVLIALVLGIPTGLLAGYGGKFVDGAFSSVASATLAFPLILFAILIVASFGTTPLTLVGIIGFLFFPRVFLLVRAQTLSLKQREFVVAVRVTGVGPIRTLVRHVLPNAAGPLLTLIPQLMAEAILIETGLSYLGLGVQLPLATWGTILESSKDFYVTAPTYAVVAGLTITLVAALLMWAGELAAESSNPLRRRRLA